MGIHLVDGNNGTGDNQCGFILTGAILHFLNEQEDKGKTMESICLGTFFVVESVSAVIQDLSPPMFTETDPCSRVSPDMVT